MRIWVLALAAAGLVAQPAMAQLADRFAPAAEAVPTSGPRLPLGKCVNLSNMLDAPDEGDWGRALVDDDIARIADAGFTSIRLPARFSAHAGKRAPYAIDRAFMERVAHIVDLATARGLAVIVDMHHYEELFSDPARQAPRFAALWRQIGERFRDAPPSVSFELINEPQDRLGAGNLLAVLGPALAEVRRSNPTRTVVIDGPEWSGLDAMLTSPFPDDAYAVPTFHYYSPVNFGFDKADWLDPPTRDEFGTEADFAEISRDLAKVEGYIARTGRVPFVGEYGAHESKPVAERAEYYETLSEAFASIGVQSCAWGYTNTFSLWSDDGGWMGGAAARIATPVIPAGPPPGSPVARHGALSVSDGKIVGAHGQPVTLRGMSLFWSQWAPQYYAPETVAWLARDWQVDVVRAAIAAEGQDGARQHFEREFAKASAVIDAAVVAGVYVVVDWHAHRPYPEEAVRFLTAIARKYGHLPNLIYEDWNEPLRDGVDWSRDVKPYHLRVIGAIRAIDPDNLVIAGSPSWSQDVDLAAADPLPFANLAYTLHYYAATHGQELRDKADAALARGVALLITEFGTVEATGNGPIDRSESEAWWDWAEGRHVGWMGWSIGDRAESSAALEPGTPPAGWSMQNLTESGQMIRAKLRAMTARNPLASRNRAAYVSANISGRIRGTAEPKEGMKMNAPVRTTVNKSLIGMIVAVATIGGLLFGYDSGAVNGTQTGLTEAFDLDATSLGFTVGSLLIGCAVGAFFAGRLADIIGRRSVMILAALLFVAGALVQGWTDVHTLFVIARFSGGMAVGAASVLSPLYISEVAPANIRGRLSTVQQVMIITGLTAAFLVNYFLAQSAGSSLGDVAGIAAWRWMYLAQAAPAVVFLVALFFIPESPRYLVSKGRSEDARKVLTSLFGPAEADRKIGEIEASFSADHRPSFRDVAAPGTVFRPIVWAGIMLATFQQFVGINIIFYYGETLWKLAGISEEVALERNIISGLVSIAAVLAALAVIDKIGRKPLLLIGSVGMAATLGAMTWAFSGAESDAAGNLMLAETAGYTALVAANLYVIFFNFSWGPVMWVMLGEMFPNQMRGSALAVAGLAQWGANYFVVQSFPAMADGIGLAGTYALYTASAVISIFLVKKFIQETKGKELEEMEG